MNIFQHSQIYTSLPSPHWWHQVVDWEETPRNSQDSKEWSGVVVVLVLFLARCQGSEAVLTLTTHQAAVRRLHTGAERRVTASHREAVVELRPGVCYTTLSQCHSVTVSQWQSVPVVPGHRRTIEVGKTSVVVSLFESPGFKTPPTIFSAHLCNYEATQWGTASQCQGQSQATEYITYYVLDVAQYQKYFTFLFPPNLFSLEHSSKYLFFKWRLKSPIPDLFWFNQHKL